MVRQLAQQAAHRRRLAPPVLAAACARGAAEPGRGLGNCHTPGGRKTSRNLLPPVACGAVAGIWFRAHCTVEDCHRQRGCVQLMHALMQGNTPSSSLGPPGCTGGPVLLWIMALGPHVHQGTPSQAAAACVHCHARPRQAAMRNKTSQAFGHSCWDEVPPHTSTAHPNDQSTA